MPIIKSAKKALRQNIRRRRLNLKRKEEMREAIRRFKKAAAAKEKEKATESLKLVYKKLDKLAKVGFVKKGKVNRLKSRLSKKLRNL